MIKALIFDCFGVLICDSLDSKLHDLSQSDPKAAHNIRSLVLASRNGTLNAEVAHQEVTVALAIDNQEYAQLLTGTSVKHVALMEYVRHLRADYKIGMLSNTTSASLQQWFSQQELAEHFDVVATSGDIGYAKPQLAAYQHIAEQLMVTRHDCVMVDDRADYCAAAERAGMQSIVYDGLAELQKSLAQHLSV